LELKGKLIGGIVGIFIGDLSGLPLGGLFGFFIGSFIGHYLFDQTDDKKSDESNYRQYQHKQGVFLYHTFSLCAKMAKADGVVSRAEIQLMENLMRRQFRLNDRGRAEAIKIWKKAKESTDPIDQYLHHFYRDFNRERHLVLNMMDLLFAMAAADGHLHPAKETALLRAAGVFHIGKLQYERIKGRYFQTRTQFNGAQQPRWSPLDPYYAILGAQPSESLDSIKQKFRTLAKQWHPDMVSARGASSEAMRHAKEKFQKINEAYEKIVESRKLA
jgi:DnaJ like chaperone protein